jgi:hypothetical protein
LAAAPARGRPVVSCSASVRTCVPARTSPSRDATMSVRTQATDRQVPAADLAARWMPCSTLSAALKIATPAELGDRPPPAPPAPPPTPPACLPAPPEPPAPPVAEMAAPNAADAACLPANARVCSRRLCAALSAASVDAGPDCGEGGRVSGEKGWVRNSPRARGCCPHILLL